MSEDRISPDVRRLLADCIETYAQLECLLLFGRPDNVGWSIQEAAAELRADAVTVFEAFEHLGRAGLLTRSHRGLDERFFCAAHHETVKALWHAYTDSRLDIMNLMTANALERVRTSALRMFAAAFLLDRKKDG